jgi:hypothetical protein
MPTTKNNDLGQPVTEYYAWVVFDGDGHEGVPAITVGGMTLPMMSSQLALLQHMRPEVIQLAASNNFGVKLIRLSNVEIVEMTIEIDLTKPA